MRMGDTEEGGGGRNAQFTLWKLSPLEKRQPLETRGLARRGKDFARVLFLFFLEMYTMNKAWKDLGETRAEDSFKTNNRMEKYK